MDWEESYGYQVSEYTVEDVRTDLGAIVEFFKAMPYYEHGLTLFMVNYRKFPMEVAKGCDAFIVDENTTIADLPEWMLSRSLNFVIYDRIILQAGRCVFPVKDVYGQVMGFCGWDPFEKPKYLDSRNYGYKAKQTSFYGMEKLPEYYVSKEPVFITEGLMCTLYLRWKGFQAMASLGSHLTPYCIQILKRFGSRLVVIADNDGAGDDYVRQVKWRLPLASVVQVAYGKDVDGCRSFEEGKYEEQLLRELRSLSNPFVKTELLIRR